MIIDKKEAKKAKSHKLLRNNDLIPDPDDYKMSFIRALNYYNVEYSNKDKKGWAVTHFGKKVKFNPEFPDSEFRILGTLCRILDNGGILEDHDEILMENEMKRLNTKPKKAEAVVVTPATVTTTIQDKMNDKVVEFMSEFNELVDNYTLTKEIPNVLKLVNQMGIRGPLIKKVLDKVTSQIEELNETIAGIDPQLTEGYSNFKKVELKRLLGIYNQLTEALVQAKVLTVRKTREIKIKPPAIVAKKVKYQLENADLHLRSVSPVLVVGGDELYVFNTKYRKLFHYEAIKGMTFSFKGTTLQNFDVNTSACKTIRKPEQLQALEGKRMLNAFFKSAKSTENKCNGRINDDCLLLAVWK